MTFLNIALLGGLSAISIPIIIHFFNRNRHRVVRWGAMHLLQNSEMRPVRKLQFEQILLLILRCCLPLLLALLMARPVLSGFDALIGEARSSKVFVIDNSYSMDAGGGNNTAFKQAQDAVEQFIEKLPRGSDSAIVLMSGSGDPSLEAPSLDKARLEKRVSELNAGYGKAQVPNSLDRANQILADMNNTFREIILVSDFQHVSWNDNEGPARAALKEALASAPFKPRLTLMKVGKEHRQNIAVTSAEASSLVLGVQQPVRIRATIRNYGDTPYTALRVYFRVDGRERDAIQIDLAGGEEQQVLFNHTFDEAGSHFVEVHADGDALEADNRFALSLPVWESVPVLLVDGAPSPKVLEGDADFLFIALQPFTKARSSLQDLITPTRTNLREFTPEMLNGTKAVILTNIDKLSPSQHKALVTYVKNGGGLMIFPGDRLDTKWHNNDFATADGGLLPSPWVTLAGGLEETDLPAIIQQGQFNHPALELFNNPQNGKLSDGQIKVWYRMNSMADSEDTTVLARFDSGDPFLIEKRIEAGRVIQVATTADPDWNNLPARPFFLPLMQRLVTYLASSVHPPRNLDVGQPLSALFPTEEIGNNARLESPGGKNHSVPILARRDRAVAEFSETHSPGLYTLTDQNDRPIHYVVNTGREESDLALMNDEESQRMAAELDAEWIDSADAYESIDHERRFGQEIWKPLFWILLLFLFGELFLQQYFSKTSTNTQDLQLSTRQSKARSRTPLYNR